MDVFISRENRKIAEQWVSFDFAFRARSGGLKRKNPPWPPPSRSEQSGKRAAEFGNSARQRSTLLQHFTQQLSGKMRMIAIVKMRPIAVACLSVAAAVRED